MDFWFALSLTFLAGIATVLGGLMATHKVMLRRGALAVALSFSAGAMLYVSFTDILGKSQDAFGEIYEGATAYGLMALSFFIGISIMVIADKLIPKEINPNDQEGVVPKRSHAKRALMHSGLFIGLALCLHNFPEGFLVFMTAYDDPNVGIAIAIAIALAIHNIPEGIAIAAPLYAATKNRFASVGLAGLTGLAEPVGAVIGFLLLQNFLTPNVFGWVFGIVAGMMVFICIDELLPAAQRYATRAHHVVYGTSGGMAVVALSLVLVR